MPGDGLAHSGSRLPLGHTGAEEQLETGALLPERRTQAISCADRPHTGRLFKCHAHLLPPLTARGMGVVVLVLQAMNQRLQEVRQHM